MLNRDPSKRPAVSEVSSWLKDIVQRAAGVAWDGDREDSP